MSTLSRPGSGLCCNNIDKPECSLAAGGGGGGGDRDWGADTQDVMLSGGFQEPLNGLGTGGFSRKTKLWLNLMFSYLLKLLEGTDMSGKTSRERERETLEMLKMCRRSWVVNNDVNLFKEGLKYLNCSRAF